MLSDEEWKAIEILTNKRPSEQMLISGKMCVNVLINLIEKQSKEIEELDKENTRQHELIGNIHKKWEDKIKAKIEEYEKNKKILEERKNGVFYSVEEIDKVDRNIKFYDVMINEMQLLLEKE